MMRRPPRSTLSLHDALPICLETWRSRHSSPLHPDRKRACRVAAGHLFEACAARMWSSSRRGLSHRSSTVRRGFGPHSEPRWVFSPGSTLCPEPSAGPLAWREGARALFPEQARKPPAAVSAVCALYHESCRSEEGFSRNSGTDRVWRLLLAKKKEKRLRMIA